MNYILIYLLLINFYSFTIMFIDKRFAIKKHSRISEKALFTTALIGGSLGIYLGMFAFRHKTKHLWFLIFIPGLILVDAFVLYFVVFR
ncbi:MAG: hypothetical protein A2Y24_05130 [Clostridiales bacterium GWE2_32_10]|nr:MAG: hypothetical protein A2Y24_05130 [Clostridiales bacterium GWE2_32_10]HBY21017.1 DUF1294 domain-containing protein [Clostridiales bacterium]